MAIEVDPQEVILEVTGLLKQLNEDNLTGLCDQFHINIPTAKQGNEKSIFFTSLHVI